MALGHQHSREVAGCRSGHKMTYRVGRGGVLWGKELRQGLWACRPLWAPPCLPGLLRLLERTHGKHSDFLRRKVLRKHGYYCYYAGGYHMHTHWSFLKLSGVLGVWRFTPRPVAAARNGGPALAAGARVPAVRTGFRAPESPCSATSPALHPGQSGWPH